MPSIVDLKLSGRANVAVGIPSTEYMHRPSFQAFMFLAQTLKPGDRQLHIQETAVVSEARNTIIKAFLELPKEVQYLFLFDADMVPPTNIIERFVGADLPFVSAYCVRKYYPYQPVPAKFVGMREHYGQPVYEYQPITDMEPNTGVHRCDGVGAAAICVRRDVLAAIEPPWFKFEHGGEDYYFCRKVQEVRTPDMPDGVWITVDTGIQVGHTAEHVAYPDDWFRIKEQYIRESGEEEVVIGERTVLHAEVRADAQADQETQAEEGQVALVS